MIPVIMLLIPLIGAAAAPLAGLRKPAAREVLLRLFTLAELALAAGLFIRVRQGAIRNYGQAALAFCTKSRFSMAESTSYGIKSIYPFFPGRESPRSQAWL